MFCKTLAISLDQMSTLSSDKPWYGYDRSFLAYAREFLIHPSALNGRRFENEITGKDSLSWLDSGCGYGNAFFGAEMFNPGKHDYTGISMHFFPETIKIKNELGERFQFFLGKSQEVIPSLSKQDLITDVFGAYLYTSGFEQRYSLLQQYYQLLSDDGIGFIRLPDYFNYKSRWRLEARLATAYPEIFEIHLDFEPQLIIHKREQLLSAELPLSQFEIEAELDAKLLEMGDEF